MSDEYKWDFFISHASEDKDEIARPLAETLQALGFSIWYDEFSLKLGDSLNQTINYGLSSSAFGIVIFSPSFIAKTWPQRELNGIVALGGDRLIPLWHNISEQELKLKYPILTDLKAVSTQIGIEGIIREIIRKAETSLEMPDIFPTPADDIVFFGDVIESFKQIPEFKERELSSEEVGEIYQILYTFGVRTRKQLNELVTSTKIADEIRQIYRELLNRPNELLFAPLEFTNAAAFLFSEGISKFSLDHIKDTLRVTKEYQKQHPDEKVVLPLTLQLPIIASGKQLGDVLACAHALHFDHDEAASPLEAQLIADFADDVQEWGNFVSEMSVSERIAASFELNRKLDDLKLNGFNVYATVHIQDRKIGNTIIPNFRIAYVVVTRKNLSNIIGILKL